MPVVVVTAQALPARADTQALLTNINRDVADSLELQPTDVYSTFVSVTGAALGPDEVRPWPIAVLHGGRRENADAAAAAVEKVLAAAYSCATDEVWVQWAVRE